MGKWGTGRTGDIAFGSTPKKVVSRVLPVVTFFSHTFPGCMEKMGYGENRGYRVWVDPQKSDIPGSPRSNFFSHTSRNVWRKKLLRAKSGIQVFWGSTRNRYPGFSPYPIFPIHPEMYGKKGYYGENPGCRFSGVAKKCYSGPMSSDTVFPIHPKKNVWKKVTTCRTRDITFGSTHKKVISQVLPVIIFFPIHPVVPLYPSSNSESRKPNRDHLGAVVTGLLESPTFVAVQAHTRKSLVWPPTAKDVGDSSDPELALPVARVRPNSRYLENFHL
jgi:hypothetical protein